ncbi:opacity family porin [Uruburuella testudinis]|uniref:Opacity family porin n=1 Tax=Uruburuella testudinis TaxID=1282863 RepID=A0ABY4DVE8_9NEIS|nr:opacity family porin [Uruburuella testudinis]UOO82438.1 opacity family porin [Uruburuella testudinis]
MKKIVLAAILAGVSSMAAAEGWYLQGDAGYSKLTAKESGRSFKDNSPTARIAVGKDTGNLRYAVDYTYFGQLENQETSTNAYHKAEVSAHSVGVSAIYDFHNQSALTPYAGVRIGLNYLNLDAEEERTTAVSRSHISKSESNTRLGAGAVLGAQYQFTDKLALNTGVEYNYLGKIGSQSAKVHQYGANLGVRYNF